MTRPLTHLPCYPAAGPAADPRLREAGALEWLLTDGRSGYACSTVTLCPARRYHGLLAAPIEGTARRHLFLAALVDAVVVGGATVTLSAPRSGGEAAAGVPPHQVAFDQVPWPVFTYQVGGLEVRREILMPAGRHALLVRYTITAGFHAQRDVGLVLRPLLACREADQLTFRNDALRQAVEVGPRGIRARCYDALPAVDLTLDAPGGAAWEFAAGPEWWCGVEYAIDLERGYGGHEDLFCPGALAVGLRTGGELVLAASIEGPVEAPADLWQAEAARRRAAVPRTLDLKGRCALAAGDFLYARDGRRGVLAGFPWFDEWGRDTFIALPGLTLARGDLGGCAEVLSGARRYLQDGLVPNIFGATIAASHYGSVDAALWFARAVDLYGRAGGDRERILEEYYPALCEIEGAYRDGTAPAVAALGIRGDDAGLVQAGTPDLNPTWMDARPASGPVTPRHGCPVEIAALWFALLDQLAELAGERGDDRAEARYTAAAGRAGAAFVARFWDEDRGCLADVWRDDAVDWSLRPNMVLAAAQERSPLTRAQRAGVVAAAQRALLTPFGLRTLAPDDPAYVGRYRGGPEERDAAYHQGTVWPWLLGSYVEAALRAAPDPADPALRRALRACLAPLEAELDHGGLGHLNEVYDGDAPHARGGTFAQAWSTAEVLRALALLDGSLSLTAGGVR